VSAVAEGAQYRVRDPSFRVRSDAVVDENGDVIIRLLEFTEAEEEQFRADGFYVCFQCGAVARKGAWGPGRVVCPLCGKHAPSACERESFLTPGSSSL
jgi:rubrerythrin